MQNKLALLSFGCFYIVFIFGPTYQGSKLVAIKMHIFLVSPFRYFVILNHLFEVFQGLFFAFLLWRGDTLGGKCWCMARSLLGGVRPCGVVSMGRLGGGIRIGGSGCRLVGRGPVGGGGVPVQTL